MLLSRKCTSKKNGNSEGEGGFTIMEFWGHGGVAHFGISEGTGGIKHGSRPWLGMDIFWNCPFKHNHFSWYNLGSLSKDHNRNTLPTRTKLIPYLRFKTLKNNTLLHSTYQSSPYTCMGVPPLGIIYLMYPMVGKKSPRVLSYVSYKDMCCPKWLHCINFVHFGLE